MKEIVVLSGKGGTGKTTIVGSFAALAKTAVIADCDVDAADLHLLLSPKIKQKHDFYSGQVASIDLTKCTKCSLCQQLCRFEAIFNFIVDPVSCEGCGFCSRICAFNAITMNENKAGEWYISETKYGPLVHARLGIAQDNSGKLVALVRAQAQSIFNSDEFNFIISDGPPGIGCPVISSLSGANLALIVTEPTFSGIHDLKRIISTCNHFGVPAVVCVNKYDLNEANTKTIVDYCQNQNIKLTAKIPFDNIVIKAMVEGIPVVEYCNNQITREITSLWQDIVGYLDN